MERMQKKPIAFILALALVISFMPWTAQTAYGATADYTLLFSDKDGAWKLYEAKGNNTLDYTDSGNVFDISGNALTIAKNFEFSTTQSYALNMENGAELFISAGAIVSLKTEGTGNQQAPLYAEGDVFLIDVGTGAALNIQTDTTNQFSCAILADGDLEIQGNGTVSAISRGTNTGGSDGINANDLNLTGNVKVVAEGKSYGVEVYNTLSMHGASVLTAKGGDGGGGYAIFSKHMPNGPAYIKLDTTTINPGALIEYAYSSVIENGPNTGRSFSTVRGTFEDGGSVGKYVRLRSNSIAPVIKTGSLPDGTDGVSYSTTIKAIGSDPITWSAVSGALPNGLTLATATGIISGTPTSIGTFNFSVKASDPYGTDTKAFTIKIGTGPSITTTAGSLKAGKVGTAYSTTIEAIGTAPITWAAISGSLPDGLAIATATGIISGTPTSQGAFDFTIKAGNKHGSDTKAYTITIGAADGGNVPPTGGNGGGSGGTTENKDEALVIVDGKEYKAGIVSVDEKKDMTTTVVDQEVIKNRIADADKSVVVIVPSGTANSSAQLILQNFEDMEKEDITFTVDAGNVKYQFHASAMDLADIMLLLGADDPEKVKISFNIMTGLDEQAKLHVEKAVSAAGGELMLSPFEFTAVASYNGKTMEIQEFLKYVSRIVKVHEEEAKYITTAVRVDEDGNVFHVPTRLYKEGEQWYAEINSLTNSSYALIIRNASFDDVSGKWYEKNVIEMAQKKVLEGTGNELFEGDKPVTRAEFAAIVVRALGLPENEDESDFSDVASGEWYHDVVSAAYRYGVVSGYPDDRFLPNENITREEAMAMVQRAAKITELNAPGKSLAGFDDLELVADWAMDAAKFNTGAELVVGDNGMLKPKENITRAESAVVILRLLEKSQLVGWQS